MTSDRWEWFLCLIFLAVFTWMFTYSDLLMSGKPDWLPKGDPVAWQFQVTPVPTGMDILFVAPEAREKLMKCMRGVTE